MSILKIGYNNKKSSPIIKKRNTKLIGRPSDIYLQTSRINRTENDKSIKIYVKEFDHGEQTKH